MFKTIYSCHSIVGILFLFASLRLCAPPPPASNFCSFSCHWSCIFKYKFALFWCVEWLFSSTFYCLQTNQKEKISNFYGEDVGPIN